MQLTEVKIRIPKDTYDVIKKKAVEENRSANKQIIQILQDAVKVEGDGVSGDS